MVLVSILLLDNMNYQDIEEECIPELLEQSEEGPLTDSTENNRLLIDTNAKLASGCTSVKRIVPITVLTGFLGAGKSTILNKILFDNSNTDGDGRLKIAVIMNEFGQSK